MKTTSGQPHPLENPFVYANPVGDFKKSIPRTTAIEQVITAISRKEYVSVMVPKNSGKTTFLFQLREHVSDCIYIDIKGSGCNSLDEITQEFILKIGKKPNDYVSTDFLKFLCKSSETMGQIFLIDDLCHSREVAAEFLRDIRTYYSESIADHKNKRHVFVIAGSLDLGDLTLNQDALSSPFNIATIIYLQDFTQEELFEFIKNKQGNSVFSDESIGIIFKYTNGHPFLIQFICHHLFGMSETEIHEQLTDINKLISNISLDTSQLIRGITYNLWDKSDRNTNLTSLLKKILDGNSIPFMLSSKPIRELYLQGCIRDDNRQCAIRNPIFEHIFKQQFQLYEQLDSICEQNLADKSTIVSEPMLTQIAEDIKQLKDTLHGPTLSNYSGFVVATIAGRNKSANTGNSELELKIQFVPAPPSLGRFAEINFRSGKDMPEVEFTVALYSQTGKAIASRQTIKLSPYSESEILRFGLTLPNGSNDQYIYAQVLQKIRLMQTLTVPLLNKEEFQPL